MAKLTSFFCLGFSLLAITACGSSDKVASVDTGAQRNSRSMLPSDGFKDVKAKFCGSVPIPVRSGERVYLGTDEGIIGVGYTENNCRVVDFQQVALVQSSSDSEQFEVNKPIGRRSTCGANPNSLQAYAGPDYRTASIKPNSLVLDGVSGECSSVTFIF